MIYSHDTGEDRPLVEICDECDHDPETCGFCPDDCEADAAGRAAEDAWEAQRDAYD